MASAPPAPQTPDGDRRLEVIRAVDRFDPRKSKVWTDLRALSAQLELQGHSADPEGVIVTGNSFRGVMNLYVVLRYAQAESAEAFPAIFEGHFVDDGTAIIDTVQVKTESFFA